MLQLRATALRTRPKDLLFGLLHMEQAYRVPYLKQVESGTR